MKQKLESLLLDAVTALKTQGLLAQELNPTINIERARDINR
jgi:hypothetical protein